MTKRRQRTRAATRRPETAAMAFAPAPAPSATAPKLARGVRLTGIDALRGGAICLMIVYHFCFDLRYFRVMVGADFERDPFWLGFRAVIVASFLALVGVSLVLADEAHVSRVRFWRRVGVIAACALGASIGSYLVFPKTYIYFGILHCIAVSSVLAWPLVRQPWVALALGVAVVAAGLALAYPVFDQRALSWIGFTTTKPRTEDYVPLLPWAGVVLIGIAIGHALVRTRFRALAPLAGAPRWLQWLGRHSLLVYMVHQPILMGPMFVLFGR
jgi:uncharacterized membrane protein